MIKRRNLSPELITWLSGIGALGPATGELWYLAPAASSTAQFYTWLTQNGVKENYISTDFATIYAKMVTGRNDTLIVLPGSHTLSAVVTWSKSYTHMIGAAPPMAINSRCRFAATTAGTPLVTISGSGNHFRNIMWSQDGTHATNYAVNGYVTGARNLFEYCTWRNLGALAYVDNSCRNLKLSASDGENEFYRCTLGADTIDGGTATNYNLEVVMASSNPGNARTRFKDCYILGNGSANSSFMTCTANNSLGGGWMEFDRCRFYNNMQGDLDQMTQGFNLNTLANGVIYMLDNLVYGAATLETSNSGMLIGRNAYAAATSDSGVALTF